MSVKRTVTRRRLLARSGLAASVLGIGLASPRLVFSQEKKAVKFTLPWVAEGSNLYTFVAKGMLEGAGFEPSVPLVRVST